MPDKYRRLADNLYRELRVRNAYDGEDLRDLDLLSYLGDSSDSDSLSTLSSSYYSSEFVPPPSRGQGQGQSQRYMTPSPRRRASHFADGSTNSLSGTSASLRRGRSPPPTPAPMIRYGLTRSPPLTPTPMGRYRANLDVPGASQSSRRPPTVPSPPPMYSRYDRGTSSLNDTARSVQSSARRMPSSQMTEPQPDYWGTDLRSPALSMRSSLASSHRIATPRPPRPGAYRSPMPPMSVSGVSGRSGVSSSMSSFPSTTTRGRQPSMGGSRSGVSTYSSSTAARYPSRGIVEPRRYRY
ncbi:hypothetical protein GGR54DRAFT_615260 [Hypoxylon sp. NC1633]|nr:hypothetical protein GGR54DRAFT_615260 [Hypoxylon sp. NC1633]